MEDQVKSEVKKQYTLIKAKCNKEYEKEVEKLIKDEIETFKFDIKTGKF